MSFKSAAVWDQLSSALATQSPDQIKKVNLNPKDYTY